MHFFFKLLILCSMYLSPSLMKQLMALFVIKEWEVEHLFHLQMSCINFAKPRKWTKQTVCTPGIVFK